MSNRSKHNNKNDLFIFLENLKVEMFNKKLSPKEIYKNKLIISNLLKKHDFNSVNLSGENITMYLIEDFKFFKIFFDKKELQKTIDKCKINHQNKGGLNIVMYILKYNKDKELGFTREDIISLLEKIDLNQQDKYGWNVLMYILSFNKAQDLGFTRNDVFSLLDKFDLSQKTNDNSSIYDFALDGIFNKIDFLNKKELSYFVSKLDIEMTDWYNNIIFVKELKNGLCFDSEELVEKIMNTKNKEIIDCVHQHISQITWQHDKLFLFLKKNNLIFKMGFLN